MKKLIASILFLSLAFSFIACKKENITNSEPVTLTMWHNFSGHRRNTLDHLIDEYNTTIGKEKGVFINVTSISYEEELNSALSMVANNDPGAPAMPDIFSGYPKVAFQFIEKNMLVNFEDYFSKKELDAYVDDFLNEGKLSGGLYVFPIAKSTEVLYLNRTQFDRFAQAVGADISDLASFDGLARLAPMYTTWMQSQNSSYGNYFFSCNDWINLAQMGTLQMGKNLFDANSNIDLHSPEYEKLFHNFYEGILSGSIISQTKYATDYFLTGELLCTIGSSAGVLFYNNFVNFPDGKIEEIEFNVLPFPVFKGGKNIAIQRGAGMMVAKSTSAKEKAACDFIKWITAPEQNLQIVAKTGYLPVTKEAFGKSLFDFLDPETDEQLITMFTTVEKMLSDYTLTTPNFSEKYEETVLTYEASIKELMKVWRDAYVSGKPISEKAALEMLRSRF